jgi:hypothetical protein
MPPMFLTEPMWGLGLFLACSFRILFIFTAEFLRTESPGLRFLFWKCLAYNRPGEKFDDMIYSTFLGKVCTNHVPTDLESVTAPRRERSGKGGKRI